MVHLKSIHFGKIGSNGINTIHFYESKVKKNNNLVLGNYFEIGIIAT